MEGRVGIDGIKLDANNPPAKGWCWYSLPIDPAQSNGPSLPFADGREIVFEAADRAHKISVQLGKTQRRDADKIEELNEARRQAYLELEKYGANVDVFDPWADADEADHEYGLRPVKKPKNGTYDALVMGVAHREFRKMGINRIRELAKKTHVLYDIKYVFPAAEVDGRL
jgi:UDP-N-acetyl-D-mannosaminuronate dehydrogenase